MSEGDDLGRQRFPASGKVRRDASRAGFVALPERARDRSRDKTEWEAYKQRLLSGGASSEIHITFGLASEALLADDQEEFRFQLEELYRACLETFKDIAGLANAQSSAEENGGRARGCTGQ